MNYSHILLDLDGTVFNFSYAERKAFFKLCEEFGIEADENMYELYKEANMQRWKDYELGKYPKEKIVLMRFDDIFSKYNINGDCSEYNRRYMELLAENTKLFEGAQEVLNYLKGHYVVSAVTNANPRIQYEKLKRTRIEGFFDKFFISEEIGAQKPKKEFFDAVFSYYNNVDKRNFLVVGDSLSADIKGACLSGLDSVWVKGKEKFMGEYEPTYTIECINNLILLLKEI